MLSHRSNNPFRSLLIALIFCLSIAGCNPIRNMDDPRVSTTNFKFTDYDYKGMKAFIDTQFPIGTKKSFVEDVLVTQGGARPVYIGMRSNKDTYNINYIYEYSGLMECMDIIPAYFDRKTDLLVKKLELAGGCL